MGFREGDRVKIGTGKGDDFPGMTGETGTIRSITPKYIFIHLDGCQSHGNIPYLPEELTLLAPKE